MKKNAKNVNQTQNQNDFLAYPNPANNNLYLSFKDSSSEPSGVIRNALGQIVLKVNANVIDTSSLANGFYFLEIDGVTKSKKIIIKH